MNQIVGVPSTSAQKNKYLLHHTLGDGQFNVFEKAARGVTAAQAFLQSAVGACEEIDRVLLVALTSARPTYLSLPTDLVFAPVSSARLDNPVVPAPVSVANSPKLLPTGEKLTDEKIQTLAFVTKEIERLWLAAKNPIVLVGFFARRPWPFIANGELTG
jgi:pyruvate decarboxylase